MEAKRCISPAPMLFSPAVAPNGAAGIEKHRVAICRRLLLSASLLVVVLCSAALCMPAYALSGTSDEVTTLRPAQSIPKKIVGDATKAEQDASAREVTKRGNNVLVSPEFAALVKKNNQVLLSKVAFKARTDRKGQLKAYELVTIDRGSAVSRMGFKPGDLIAGVNGIPVRDFNANRECLESATRFDVEFWRKGKSRRLNVEIR